MSGNPFCEEASYKDYVIAHLPELVYLDFRLIDESAREAATERYKYSIEELVHDETIAKRKLDEQQAMQKERQLHKVSFIEVFLSSGYSVLPPFSAQQVKEFFIPVKHSRSC